MLGHGGHFIKNSISAIFSREFLPQIRTWGGRILTLYLNYVAGYTDPLLFLFERTQHLTLLTTMGKPWRLRVWAGPKFTSSKILFWPLFRASFHVTTQLARQVQQERRTGGVQ